jgi:hypothetical protein
LSEKVVEAITEHNDLSYLASNLSDDILDNDGVSKGEEDTPKFHFKDISYDVNSLFN